MTVDSRSRIPGVDVLRGISIVAVILLHANLRIRFSNSVIGQHLSSQALNVLFRNGHNAVIIFFAISGFLITGTCLRRWGSLQDIRLGAFYQMRFARIAPLLLALLAVLSLLHAVGAPGYTIDPNRTSLGQAIFSALTFHLNWLEAKRGYLPGSWDVLWSLSVEELFYLLFPLLCLVCRGSRALPFLLLVFVALGPFARTAFTNNEMWADHSYLSCMDAIALGCLAAITGNRFRIQRPILVAFRVTGIATIVFVTTFRHAVAALGLYRSGLDVSALAIGTCFLLIALAQPPPSNSQLLAPLRWLGANSYEVYLTHMFVVTTSMQLFEAAARPYTWILVWYAMTFALSGLLGGVTAHFYSEPLNRWLRPRRSPGNELTGPHRS